MPRKILLFIPGYYGSVLKEKESGKIRWAKASNFLFSTQGLGENLPGTKLGTPKKFIVDGVLKNVTVFPKYWDVDAYKLSIDQLQDFAQKNNMTLEELAYDWRDDFVGCLKSIDEKIKSFHLTPEDEITVVAHSMGALLTTYYLRYGAQDVESAIETWEGAKLITKVALVTPPLHGLMILFRDIEDGTSLGLNRTLLSSLDYSLFKSSYFFLPPKGEDVGVHVSGEKLTVGIHDLDKWEQNNWGLFKHAKPSEKKIVREYVGKYLHRSEKFHELLRAPIVDMPVHKMPLLHVRGLGHKTLELPVLKPSKERLRYVFDKRSAVDGDGTVTAKSSAALSFFKAFHFTTIDTPHTHLDALVKPEAQEIIQKFILNP